MAARTTLTLSEHLDEYLANKEGRVGKRTLVSEEITCRRFVAWWDGKRMHPKKLDPRLFAEFLHGKGGLAYWVRKPEVKLEKTAFNKELGRLKEFLEWMIICDVLQPTLLQSLKNARHRKAKPRPRIWLTLAQIHEVVHGAEDPWERFILAAYAYTAGREGELLDRQYAHLGTDNRIQWHRHKTDDSDRLPVLPELEDAVREWLTYFTSIRGAWQGNWHLVPGRQRTRATVKWKYNPHRPPSSATVSAVVKKHVARVLKVDPNDALVGQACHIMRRSAARAMYEALLRAGYTDALEIVRDWLGHEDISTTMIYIGVEPGRRRRDEVLLGGERWLTPDTENVVPMRKLEAVN